MDRQSIPILYESENFLIVDKPFDLLINSDDENDRNTLHRILEPIPIIRESHLKHGYHFIHRLDYATSGVICLGKNKAFSAQASKLFEGRMVDKYYLALVRGHLNVEVQQINIAIGYDKNYLDSNKRMCAAGPDCIKPKDASTRILVLEQGLYDGLPATKVLMKPLTGRRHQLRLHCRLLGHTIVGDFTYSDKTDTDPPRMYLHAYRLRIPLMSEPIDIKTADPFVPENPICAKWQPTVSVNDVHCNGGLGVFEKL